MGAAYSKSNEDFVKTTIHQTNYGKIRGKKYKIEGDRYVNVFLGIPYAKPPTGRLRFQKPEPPDCWPNVKECIRYASRAPQIDSLFDRLSTQVSTSEDCLYLNVFAPEWDLFEGQENGRPALLWLHGGGFTVQSAANYGYHGICRHLCSKGVIVITVQYRLGILGFSATGDENSIPNLGLWDQAFALKWLKENLQFFGGNPDNITVFGQSAGAVCADLLSLSPYTRGLFNRVIPMGGSANCAWAIRDIQKVRDATISHAYALGWQIPENATEKMMNATVMKFLREQPAKSLALGLPKRKFKANIAGLVFGPVIDGDFIPESIAELRKKTPFKFCMTGATDYEVLLYAFNNRIKYNARKAESLLNEFIPLDGYSDNYTEIRRAAKQLYFTEHSKPEEIKRAYFKIASDLFVTNGVHDYAEDMLNNGHIVYLYNFEYFSPRVFGVMRWSMPFYGFGFWALLISNGYIRSVLMVFLAATHDTEIPYLFGKGLIDTFRPKSADLQVINTFTTMFTNFAKHGDPNGGIIQGIVPLSHDNKWRFARITKDVQMKCEFQGRRAEFWRNLREGKILLGENNKETQTDDEKSAVNTDNENVSSVASNVGSVHEQTVAVFHQYDQVPSEEELEVILKENRESRTEGYEDNTNEEQPILLNYNMLNYCNLENIRNELLNESLKTAKLGSVDGDIPNDISEDSNTEDKLHIRVKEEEPDETRTNSKNELVLSTTVLAGRFDDPVAVLLDQNAMLKRATEVEFEPVSDSQYSQYYDAVEPDELNEEDQKGTEVDSIEKAVTISELCKSDEIATRNENVEQNITNVLSTDLVCQEHLAGNTEGVPNTTITDRILTEAEQNKKEELFIGTDTKSETIIIVESSSLCSTSLLKDETDLAAKNRISDKEAVTETNIMLEGSEDEEDRPPFPMIKQICSKLVDDRDPSGDSN